MKPFDGRLASPPKSSFDMFSPEIKISGIAWRKVNVRQRLVCDINIYDFSKKESHRKNDKTQMRVYYFNGGGFQSPASSHHVRLVCRMLQGLPDGSIVSIVSYPLAPANPAPKAFPALLELYSRLLSTDSGEAVILAGDSAGGNIVLALTLEALRLDPKGPAPQAVILISPAVELTHQNPRLPAREKTDPLLRLGMINKFAEDWAGCWDAEKDPRLSPLLARNVHVLRDRDVKVHMVLGTYDILAPDAILMRNRFVEEGVSGSCLEWEGLSHCWLIMAGVGSFTKELRDGWKYLLEVLVDAGGNGK
jgi:acetyl esterase/lipase